MKFDFKLPSLSKSRESLDLSHSHILTHNFGVPQIVSMIDVIPNSDIVVDLSAFTRLTPLPCPTYGGVKITHRAYYVPFEFCLKHFNDFVGFQKQPILATSTLSHFTMPTFTVADIFKFLFQNDDLTVVQQSNDYITAVSYDPNNRYDIFQDTGSGAFRAYNYTIKGRRIVSWLAQLGYKLPPTISDPSQNAKIYSVDSLFAYWKFYLDWVVPARFVLAEPRFAYIRSILENLDCCSAAYTLNYHSNGSYGSTELKIGEFLMSPTSFLDDDHYTVSFVSPYGVENSASELPVLNPLLVQDDIPAGQSLNIPQNFGDNDPSKSAVLSAYRQVSATANRGYFNQIALLSLGRLQQLVNNKKITSTNVLDFLRLNFGVAPSHDAMRLSTYKDSFDSQIMVGDVMATATTQLSGEDPTYVGQYAGKGIGGSTAKWRFNCPMHGIIFITAEISTKSSYVNGVSPLRSRRDALDFFNEKFDNVGVRAVRRDELIMNTFEPLYQLPGTYPSPDSIFGFQPRYSEYKFHDDLVSGDFMFPSVNAGLDSWYLSRKFKVTDDPKIGLEFLSATSDSVGSQYDRIFQNTNPVDHFYSVYYMNIHDTSIKEKFLDYFKTMNDTQEDKDLQKVQIN